MTISISNNLIIDVYSDLWKKAINSIKHDIYHLPGYCHLEAKRVGGKAESVLIQNEDKIIFLPYLLRSCQDLCADTSSNLFDAISPYGYTGILISEEAKNDVEFLELGFLSLKDTLYSRGICSIFLRLHPIVNHNITGIISGVDDYELFGHGQTVSVDLTIGESEIWNHTKSDRRNKINKCKRAGMTAKMVKVEDYLDEFIQIYSQTMSRVDASSLYYDFDYEYCLELQKLLGDRLHLCIVEIEGQIASAGLYSEYEGIVQALFGGTRQEFVKLSPNSLEIDFVRYWAKDRGNNLLHLGGGLGGVKNSLYDFKASFSKLRHNYLTMRWIINRQKYNHLVEQRATQLNISSETLLNSDFFPAYRAK